MYTAREYIAELNQNYNDLGEDLVMLEAVLLVSKEEAGFPGEYVATCIERLAGYIDQHVEELRQLAECLTHPPHQNRTAR